MTHNSFTVGLQTTQPHCIHAIPLPERCPTIQIPEAFSQLLSDIILLLKRHTDKLCRNDQATVGLQPAACTLSSKVPIQLQRVIDRHKPCAHFCCTLTGLSIASQASTLTGERNSHPIIVDFTTGIVMDERHCCFYHVLDKRHPGIVYGRLLDEKLEDALKKIQ